MCISQLQLQDRNFAGVGEEERGYMWARYVQECNLVFLPFFFFTTRDSLQILTCSYLFKIHLEF